MEINYRRKREIKAGDVIILKYRTLPERLTYFLVVKKSVPNRGFVYALLNIKSYFYFNVMESDSIDSLLDKIEQHCPQQEIIDVVHSSDIAIRLG